MMSLLEKFKDLTTGTKLRTILSSLLVALLIPITLFANTQSWELRRKAAEEPRLPDTEDQLPKPEYAPGEALVKFRQGVEIKVPEKEQQPFSVEALETESSTKPLAGFLKQQGVTQLEKVFKGASDPQTELDKFKQKFPQRKINEEELLKIDLSRTYKLTFDNEVDIPTKVQELSQNPNIEYAEPNYIYSVESTPDDPDFTKLWGLNNTGQTGGTPDSDIDAPEAWDMTTGNSEVTVGVVDTGINYNHPDLAGNIWINQVEASGSVGVDDDSNGYIDDVRGWDFINNDNDPMDDEGHGTHVAGTIGAVANNGRGVVGVAWNVQLMPLKFLGANGRGSTDDASAAIYYATNLGAKITNNSWGGGSFSQTVRGAIEDALVHDALFVAASGNSILNTDFYPHYPSTYDLANIISVAATDHNDYLFGISNYGLETVDLAAPGRRIYSSTFNGGYGYASGTSMASPHVSGAAALIWSAFSNLSALEVKNRLLLGTDPTSSLQGKVATGGRLNIANAFDPNLKFYTPTEFHINLHKNDWARVSLLITNSKSDQNLEWQVSFDAPWLNTPFSSGSILPGSNQQVFIDLSTVNLEHGLHQTTINIQISSPSLQSLIIPITLNVEPIHTAEWVIGSGGLASDHGIAATVDESGNIYITGYFSNAASFDNETFTSVGEKDIFVAKYDSSGQLIWVKQAGGPGSAFSDVPTGITTDSLGNVYITGIFDTSIIFGSETLTSAGGLDIFITKYNSSGHVVWAKRAGGVIDEQSTGIATDGSDDIYLIGYFYRSTTFGDQTLTSAGSSDNFIVKYSSLGNVEWAERSGGTMEDQPEGVAVDTTGVYITGWFQLTADFGIKTLTSGGYSDIFVAKYNEDGEVLWAKQGGGADVDRGNGITTDSSGNIYVIGTYYGPAVFDDSDLPEGFGDIFIAKYGNLGSLTWVRQATTPTWAIKKISGIRVDASDNIYITGYFEGTIIFDGDALTSMGGFDIFTVKYNGLGRIEWAKRAGGEEWVVASDIVVDRLGNLYLVGSLRGSAIFDGLRLASKGETDIFIAKYSQAFCIPGSLLPGDTNCDCVVNIFDLVRVGTNYGKTENNPGWDPLADIVADGRINIFDLVKVGVNYGRTCP